jgi:hypothetical protein
MLGGLLDGMIKVELVRVIFDYSENWYPPRDMPTPPNPSAIEHDAKLALRSVANSALSLKALPDPLKAAVKKRLDFYAQQDNN